jgi:DNA-binding NarL/FixJ family response regulator
MHDELLYAERVIRAGARGYIMKQEADEVVISAIRKVLNGGIYLSPRMQEKLMRDLAGDTTRNLKSESELLSDRELEVFQMIGLGRSTRQIAEDMNVSVKTIESYRARIKNKLNLDTNTELVQRAFQWVQENYVG